MGALLMGVAIVAAAVIVIVRARQAPSGAPGQAPSGAPGQAPSGAPGQAPSYEPIEAPSGAPGQAPSYEPIEAPSGVPWRAPSHYTPIISSVTPAPRSFQVSSPGTIPGSTPQISSPALPAPSIPKSNPCQHDTCWTPVINGGGLQYSPDTRTFTVTSSPDNNPRVSHLWTSNLACVLFHTTVAGNTTSVVLYLDNYGQDSVIKGAPATMDVANPTPLTLESSLESTVLDALETQTWFFQASPDGVRLVVFDRARPSFAHMVALNIDTATMVVSAPDQTGYAYGWGKVSNAALYGTLVRFRITKYFASTPDTSWDVDVANNVVSLQRSSGLFMTVDDGTGNVRILHLDTNTYVLRALYVEENTVATLVLNRPAVIRSASMWTDLVAANPDLDAVTRWKLVPDRAGKQLFVLPTGDHQRMLGCVLTGDIGAIDTGGLGFALTLTGTRSSAACGWLIDSASPLQTVATPSNPDVSFMENTDPPCTSLGSCFTPSVLLQQGQYYIARTTTSHAGLSASASVEIAQVGAGTQSCVMCTLNGRTFFMNADPKLATGDQLVWLSWAPVANARLDAPFDIYTQNRFATPWSWRVVVHGAAPYVTIRATWTDMAVRYVAHNSRMHLVLTADESRALVWNTGLSDADFHDAFPKPCEYNFDGGQTRCFPLCSSQATTTGTILTGSTYVKSPASKGAPPCLPFTGPGMQVSFPCAQSCVTFMLHGKPWKFDPTSRTVRIHAVGNDWKTAYVYLEPNTSLTGLPLYIVTEYDAASSTSVRTMDIYGLETNHDAVTWKASQFSSDATSPVFATKADEVTQAMRVKFERAGNNAYRIGLLRRCPGLFWRVAAYLGYDAVDDKLTIVNTTDGTDPRVVAWQASTAIDLESYNGVTTMDISGSPAASAFCPLPTYAPA